MRMRSNGRTCGKSERRLTILATKSVRVGSDVAFSFVCGCPNHEHEQRDKKGQSASKKERAKRREEEEKTDIE
jgi:hypothetical protein